MVVALIGLALIGFNTVGIGFLPISDVVFFGVAGLIWLMMLAGRVSSFSSPTARRSSPRLLAATMVLLALATVSSFRSWYPLASAGVVLRLIYLTLLWFWILRCLSVNRRAIALLMTAWRWGVMISCLGALAANAGLMELGRANPENRQTGWFGHPNDLAGYIAVAVPLFVLAAPRAARSGQRNPGIRWVITMGVVIFALATTGSMSALFAAAIGVTASGISLALTRRSAGRRMIHPLKAMGVMVIAGIALSVMFSSDVPVVERLTRFGEGDSSVSHSVDTRGELNQRVINQFDELLVVGHGLDLTAQDQLRGSGSGIHNMYVKALYEAGLIAALALLAMLLITFQQAWKLLRNTRSTSIHIDVAAVFGSAVTAVVFALFQPMMFNRYFWLPFAIIQCFWTVRRAELSAQASESTDSITGDSPTISRSSVTRLAT